MTISSSAAEPFGGRLPSRRERDSANQLRRILAAHLKEDQPVSLKLLTDEKEISDVVLSPDLSRLLMDVLRIVGRGDAVTLVPVGEELTTQQAADILNVSRPYLVKILEEGVIPYATVGRHRRVKAEDLFRYKEKRDSDRAEALSDLAEVDAEFL